MLEFPNAQCFPCVLNGCGRGSGAATAWATCTLAPKHVGVLWFEHPGSIRPWDRWVEEIRAQTFGNWWPVASFPSIVIKAIPKKE
jgi:hypothetical protein